VRRELTSVVADKHKLISVHLKRFKTYLANWTSVAHNATLSRRSSFQPASGEFLRELRIAVRCADASRVFP
jgi:hypothetical protein